MPGKKLGVSGAMGSACTSGMFLGTLIEGDFCGGVGGS